MRIAVYSANIGGYRDELQRLPLDSVDCIPGVDYYFFTDKQIESKKWKVTRIRAKQPATRWMDANRNTAKYCKWVVPQILRDYDTIIWVDSKATNLLRYSGTGKTYIDNIKDMLASGPEKDLFFWKHPCRKHAREEIAITLRYKKENKVSGQTLLNIVKNQRFDIDLPDTCVFVARTTSRTMSFLQSVYNTLQKLGIARDQNVIQYCLQTSKMCERTRTFANRAALFASSVTNRKRSKLGNVRSAADAAKVGVGLVRRKR